MGYRLLADENVERATLRYLEKMGHDVERLDDVGELPERVPRERGPDRLR